MMTGDVWFWVLAGLATLFVGSSKGGLPLIGTLAVPFNALEVCRSSHAMASAKLARASAL